MVFALCCVLLFYVWGDVCVCVIFVSFFLGRALCACLFVYLFVCLVSFRPIYVGWHWSWLVSFVVNTADVKCCGGNKKVLI